MELSGGTRSVTLGLLATAIIAGCVAAIPLAARLGLLVLATAPNPRHPPSDLLGEAVGWAIVGAGVALLSTIIGDSLPSVGERGLFQTHKGLFIGAAIGLVLAMFLGSSLAELQMDSVDGQAITSVGLGIMAGAVAGGLGALAGAVAGAVVRRVIVALAP